MKTRTKILAVLAAVAIAFGVQFGDVNAASLKSQIMLTVDTTLTSTLDLTTASAPLRAQKILDLANGVAANQANVIWSDQRTIAASTTEDLDLIGGSLTDVFGTAVAPAKVRAIIISAASANTNNVVLGGDVNSVPFLSAAATTVAIQPGGLYVITAPALAGIAVTAGTGDILQVANSGAGTTVTYDIIVIGTSS